MQAHKSLCKENLSECVKSIFSTLYTVFMQDRRMTQILKVKLNFFLFPHKNTILTEFMAGEKICKNATMSTRLCWLP